MYNVFFKLAVFAIIINIFINGTFSNGLGVKDPVILYCYCLTDARFSCVTK